MSEPIRINVDPTNPGQFFACCGLLELADRLWPGAEGWFEGREFCISASGTLAGLLEVLTNSEINSSLTGEELNRLGTLLSANKANLTPAQAAEKARLSALWKRERLHLSKPFDLWIDWWFDEKTGGKAMKTWAAKQLVLNIARPMLRVIKEQNWSDTPSADVISRTAKVEGVPFYFDSHNNCQVTPRDTGFGLYTLRNDIQTESNTRPLLELLAFLGLQRCRPRRVEKSELIRYTTWATPFPIAVVSAATLGEFRLAGDRTYEFRMLSRTEYMKAILPSQLVQENT